MDKQKALIDIAQRTGKKIKSDAKSINKDLLNSPIVTGLCLIGLLAAALNTKLAVLGVLVVLMVALSRTVSKQELKKLLSKSDKKATSAEEIKKKEE